MNILVWGLFLAGLCRLLLWTEYGREEIIDGIHYCHR